MSASRAQEGAKVLGQSLRPENAALFVCDMQEKFKPAIQYFDDICTVTQRMCSAAKLLNIPIVVTEQYPRGLGNTVVELQESVSGAEVVPKTDFTMLVPDVQARVSQLSAGKSSFSVLLCGVEMHVCVQQTALDLLARGIEVYIIVDACSSRSQMDRLFAIDRLRQAGCVVTTSESALLQLVGSKDHAMFKQVQRLIMTSAPTSGLVLSCQQKL